MTHGHDWFSGPIEPTPVSRRYRAAMALTAFAMVLLPLVYLGVIGLAGWAVVWHATHNAGVLMGKDGGFGRSLLYFGPILVGVVVVLFLVKPLFSRAREPEGSMTLRHEDHPELFRFIGELCRLVGAPPPARVDVDCNVNASAGFRAGFSSLARNDLVLTIGLPLVAGMSVRQFGGVLAHEFGHFAQGGGMRASFLIRSLNAWFVRVVYQRDALDEQLDEWAEEADVRVGLVLHAARLAVWLSRRVLWVLMVAGHAISCVLLRQMEFDADTYEAKVSGSDGFESTARRLAHLGAGHAATIERLREHWKEQRLPDDFPGYLRHRTEQLPAEVLEKVDAAIRAERTGVFDTHPAWPDRVAAAAALGEPGVCLDESPASGLFRDFGAVCRAATPAFYAGEHGLDVRDHNLVPLAELTSEGDRTASEGRELAAYAPGWDGFERSVVLPAEPPSADGTAEELRGRIVAARRWVAESGPVLESIAKEADRASNERARVFALEQLGAARVQVKPSADIPATDAATLAGLRAHWESVAGEQVGAWEPSAGVASGRLDAALRLWWHEPSPEADPAAARERRAEIAELWRLAVALGSCGPALGRLRVPWQALSALFHNVGAVKTRADFVTAADPPRRAADRECAAIRATLAGYWYPFPHAHGRIRVADLLRVDGEAGDAYQEAYLAGAAILRHVPALHGRVMARLVALALQAERAQGLDAA